MISFITINSRVEFGSDDGGEDGEFDGIKFCSHLKYNGIIGESLLVYDEIEKLYGPSFAIMVIKESFRPLDQPTNKAPIQASNLLFQSGDFCAKIRTVLCFLLSRTLAGHVVCCTVNKITPKNDPIFRLPASGSEN